MACVPLRVAHEARAILERLGARPFLERLDAALAAANDGSRAATPARTTQAEAALDR